MATPDITIRVKGNWATLEGARLKRVLHDTLSALDPNRQRFSKFRNGDWDGRQVLYEGDSFPAGLVPRALESLERDGYTVKVKRPKPDPIDCTDLDPGYMLIPLDDGREVEMWDHAVESVAAMMKHDSGVIKAPTSSGKTSIAGAAALKFYCDRQYKTVIVVPKRGLMVQTVKSLKKYYHNLPITVGQIGDGVKVAGDVTVVTGQSCLGYWARRRKNSKTKKTDWIKPDPIVQKVLDGADVLMIDEAHHTGAESWYRIAMESRAKRKYGLSGTPMTGKDLMDLRLIAACGPVIHVVPEEALREKGLVSRAKIVTVYSTNASEPRLANVLHNNGKKGEDYREWSGPPKYADAYIEAVVESLNHNTAVIKGVEWMVDHGRQTLLVTRRKPHYELLGRMLDERGIAWSGAWGDHDTAERKIAVQQFEQRSVNVLLATTIFDEGESVDAIESIVLSEGVKTSVNSVQRVGRGRRRESGGVDDIWVLDFVPTGHDTLIDHALARLDAWEAEGYECRLIEDWPAPEDFDIPEDLLPFLDWDAGKQGELWEAA